VYGPEGRTLTRSARLPGGRTDVRDRSVTVAMHMLRRVLHGESDGADGLSLAVARELKLHDHDLGNGVAFSVRVGELPSYHRLRAIAEGLAGGLDSFGVPGGTPVIVLLDKDVAQTVGRILTAELGVARPLVCLDNLALDELDFVDVGEQLLPAGVYPVIVKSLLFSARSSVVVA